MTDSEKQLFANQTGMSLSDIDDHLSKFDNGGSYLVRDAIFDQVTNRKAELGYPDNSNYILSSDEMDKIIADSNGDIQQDA